MERGGRGKRRRFSAEYKAEVVRLVGDSGKSIGAIARELGLAETALRRWVQQAEIDAGRGPTGALTTSEREELGHLRRENQRLRMEREILKKGDGLLRQGERVRFAFIAAEKACFPVALMCRILAVSRAGFYAWRRRPAARRTRQDGTLAVVVARSTPSTTGAMALRGCGWNSRSRSSDRTEADRPVDACQGLRGRPKRRHRTTTDSRTGLPVCPNLLARRFAVAQPSTAWVTDMTYLWTAQGWLYLAVIIDLFSRRVVGWSMSERIDRKLALDALRMALAQRRPQPGLIHHSDRGSAG